MKRPIRPSSSRCRCPKTCDVVWIGNWGDEERTRELMEFLVGPASELPKRRLVVHGVRYPEKALRIVERSRHRVSWLSAELEAPMPMLQSAL